MCVNTCLLFIVCGFMYACVSVCVGGGGGIIVVIQIVQFGLLSSGRAMKMVVHSNALVICWVNNQPSETKNKLSFLYLEALSQLLFSGRRANCILYGILYSLACVTKVTLTHFTFLA